MTADVMALDVTTTVVATATPYIPTVNRTAACV
jgi:hypothetical protein